MNLREYEAVFGVVPFERDEMVIDVGSGHSDLSALPVAALVQIDPLYEEPRLARDSQVKIPFRLGDMHDAHNRDIFQKVTKAAREVGSARVTAGNVMRYMTKDEQVIAISQMLQMVNGLERGIVQIYPFLQKRADQAVAGAVRSGFIAQADSVRTRAVRQLIFRPVGLSSVVSITGEATKTGPADRMKCARLLSELIL